MALLRANGISAAGIVLSQPLNVRAPSAVYASCIISIQSAMSSRETNEYFIPSIPIVSPSVTTGVPKIIDLHPAFSTSLHTKSPSSRI